MEKMPPVRRVSSGVKLPPSNKTRITGVPNTANSSETGRISSSVFFTT